jgi:hypothetical protein
VVGKVRVARVFFSRGRRLTVRGRAGGAEDRRDKHRLQDARGDGLGGRRADRGHDGRARRAAGGRGQDDEAGAGRGVQAGEVVICMRTV